MPTLSYKYRIEPNRAQAAALGDMLRDFCGLYNVGLQQRIEAYRRRGISVNYRMQADELKAVRCAAPAASFSSVRSAIAFHRSFVPCTSHLAELRHGTCIIIRGL